MSKQFRKEEVTVDHWVKTFYPEGCKEEKVAGNSLSRINELGSEGWELLREAEEWDGHDWHVYLYFSRETR